jgi:broad specificity phosphatase PhoE
MAPPMPEIFLVRHGQPAFDDRTPIAGSAFAAWVRSYDGAPLDTSVPPPPGLRAQAAAVGCLAASTLRRAQESAREARSRAHRAAERLAELARTHGSVMLVGHGLMNALILRVLGNAGWRGSASRATYWSVVAMERAA